MTFGGIQTSSRSVQPFCRDMPNWHIRQTDRQATLRVPSVVIGRTYAVRVMRPNNVVLGRIASMLLPIATDVARRVVCLCVPLSLCVVHTGELCKNGWTDRQRCHLEADLCGSKERDQQTQSPSVAITHILWNACQRPFSDLAHIAADPQTLWEEINWNVMCVTPFCETVQFLKWNTIQFQVKITRNGKMHCCCWSNAKVL